MEITRINTHTTNPTVGQASRLSFLLHSRDGCATIMLWNRCHTWLWKFMMLVVLVIATISPAVGSVEKIIVDGWQISRTFDAQRVNTTQYPHFYMIFHGQWQDTKPDEQGRITLPARPEDSAEETKRVVMLRRAVVSDTEVKITLQFDTTGQSYFFLNGQNIWSGTASTIDCQLRPGLNELFLWVKENEKDWTFRCLSSAPLSQVKKTTGFLEKVWESDDVFAVPESVLYDEQRQVLYVSSFNHLGRQSANQGFISRVGLDGRVLELKWIEDLDGPCGMALVDDHLFVAECSGTVAEIDVVSGTIMTRHKIPDTSFLNDVAADDQGRVYITDTSRDPEAADIYRLEKGQIETLVTGQTAHRGNGLLALDDTLVVGSVGEGLIKQVAIDTGKVTTLTSLGMGVIDGIKSFGNGRLFVSHWEGQVYLVEPDGTITRVLDLQEVGLNTADFEYVPEQRLLIIPTFLGNKLVAYRAKDAADGIEDR